MSTSKRRKRTTIVRRAKGLAHVWHREDDPGQTLIDTIRTLFQDQSSRYQDILFWMRMYGEDLTQTYGYESIALSGSDEPLPLNVTASVIDTHVSKLVRMRPRMVCTPVEGGFSAQKTATMRTKFIDGVWQETHFRTLSRDCATDADVTGVGILKGYVEDGRIVFDRVYAEDVFVDPRDAQYGAPRFFYQVRWIDRGVAVELYPDLEEEILGAGSAGLDTRRKRKDDGHADQIMIFEGWHLPDGKVDLEAAKPRGADESWDDYEQRCSDAKWGRHVVAIDGCVLRDEPWTLPRFPFIFFFSKAPRRGFWPTGMAERLFGYQIRIYDTVEMINDNLATHGNMRTFLQEGSHVIDSDLDDETGGVVYYTGQPPHFGPTAIMPPEVYAYLYQLVSRAYEQEGQSELQAHGEIPTGMAGASGTALRTVVGISSGRDMVAGLNWDDAHQDAGELVLLLAQYAAQTDPEFSSLYIGKQDGEWMAQRYRWADVDNGGEFVIQMESTADTPRTLPGKLAMFGELEDRGIPTQEESMKAVQLESVDRILKLKTAPRRTVEYLLGRIVEENVYTAPEPFFPLQTCKELGLSYYNIAVQTQHESQELLIDWINATDELIDQMTAKSASTQAPVPGPPGDAVGVPPGPAGPPMAPPDMQAQEVVNG